MKAKCINLIGINPYRTKVLNLPNDFEDFSGIIDLDNDYDVYAIKTTKYCKHYLIYVSQHIFFVPSSCFKVFDSNIPEDWREIDFNLDEIKHHLLGYKLLINDRDHYDNLLLNDSEALMRFFKENNIFK